MRRLSRRTVLRGGGVALALPWLEAMTARPAQAQAAPVRALFVYFPSGYQRGHWVSATPGVYTDFALPTIARALEPWKAKLTLVTGLANQPASVGASDAGGIHARGTGCSLVCSPLTEKGFAGEGISADQLIVQKVGAASCISSLVLGLPNERTPSFAEEGLSSIYYNNVSFTGPRSPVHKVSDPADLFVRLVTCPGFGPPPSDRRARFERGVMSAVKERAAALARCVGQEDRLRLDEYYTAVSELERRFLPRAAGAPACPGLAAPPAAGATLAQGARAMIDVAVLAFQCGLTRVGTLMMDGAFSRRDYGLPGLGGANYIHGLSHGEFGGEDRDGPRWMKITTHYFELFAYLLAKLDGVREGQGSMLDGSVVYIGSEFGDGHAHDVRAQPLVIAGGGGGQLRPGRHIAVGGDAPLANALLSVMRVMGLERPTFGDSTGVVGELLR